MRGYKDRARKKGSIFYFLIGIVLLLVMFKWGIPIFIDVLAGSSNKNGMEIDDSVPPQIPLLSALPEATNSATVYVEGYTDADTEVTVYVNDQAGNSNQSDGQGSFLLEAKLEEGENRVEVKAKNKEEKESHSVIKVVTYDKTPIELTIEAPKDGTQFFGKNSQVAEFRGKVNETGAEVTINGSFARVTATGEFTQLYRLSEGENKVKVVAVDRAGNRTEKEISLTFSL